MELVQKQLLELLVLYINLICDTNICFDYRNSATFWKMFLFVLKEQFHI